jgi:hypothetical protein
MVHAWTEVNDLNTARGFSQVLAGTQTSGIAANGSTDFITSK